jgi:hypothetical protein
MYHYLASFYITENLFCWRRWFNIWLLSRSAIGFLSLCTDMTACLAGCFLASISQQDSAGTPVSFAYSSL